MCMSFLYENVNIISMMEWLYSESRTHNHLLFCNLKKERNISIVSRVTVIFLINAKIIVDNEDSSDLI